MIQYEKDNTHDLFGKARWVSTFDNHENHMTDTGVKGLDLYFLNGDTWRFAGSGRPQGKNNEALIITNMESKEREYMLYLSLYDGVDNVEIGVDENASIGTHPRRTSPKKARHSSAL